MSDPENGCEAKMAGQFDTPERSATIGRPVEPVPEAIADEVVEWLGNGKTLRSYCRQDGKPAYTTVYEWIKKDTSFAERIARARDSGHDAIADDCLEIIDTAKDANLGKARVWTRLQLLAKWNPKKYGERRIVAGDEENPLTIKSVLVPERIATKPSGEPTPEFGE